jgi:tetratricopeptide (TPR) repeat protein
MGPISGAELNARCSAAEAVLDGGTRSAEDGRAAEALARFEEAAGKYRAVIRDVRDQSEDSAELYEELALAAAKAAVGLSLSGIGLCSAGRDRLGVDVIHEALVASKTMAELDPRIASDVAFISHRLACALLDRRQPGQALEHAIEAMDRYVGLVGIEANGYAPALASAMMTAALAAGLMGQLDQGVQLAADAAGLFREMAAADPVLEPDLASALNHVSFLRARRNHHGSLRRESAKDVQASCDEAEEAVAIYRGIAETDPEAHMSGLAVALRDLATVRLHAGLEKTAADAAEEAVKLYRPLAEKLPHVYRLDLCSALVVLSETTYRMGRTSQALDAAREAVEIARGRCAQDPGPVEPELALALRALAMAEMATTGAIDVAVAASEEAYAIHDRLHEKLPTAYHEERFLSRVAMSETHYLRDMVANRA